MANIYYTRWWTPVTRLVAVLGVAVFAGVVEYFARVLQDDIASNLERYATAFVIAQALLLALLVLGLVVIKWLRLRVAGVRDARRSAIEGIIVATAGGEPGGEHVVKLRAWYADSVFVMSRALNVLDGPARDRIESLLLSDGFVPALIADANGSDTNRAIRAVTLLGRLHDPGAMSAVERTLQHPSAVVRVAACRAILAHGSGEVQFKVLAELARLPAWQRLVLFHLIPIDSPVLLQFLQGALASADDTMRLLALEFVLSRQRVLLLLCPAELVTAANLEVRIKFFRALPFLLFEADIVEVLRAGVADADWRVRAMAARACGYFRATELVGELKRMCAADSNPVEVGHAARALTRIGGHVWDSMQPLISGKSEMVRRVTAEAVEKSMLVASATGPRNH